MRSLLVVTLCFVAGCLTAPDPTGDGKSNTNGSNQSNNLNNDNNADDAGDDSNTPDDDMAGADRDAGDDDLEPQCASCSVGATRCAPEGEAVQECVDADGCHLWVTQTTCEGAQTCSEEKGCSCPDVCVPGEQGTCGPDGVLICRLIEGCPQLVDVGRTEGCDPPGAPNGAPSCEDRPEMSYCQPCGDGRGCNQFCENDRGWSCGVP